jgi:hypothetical protein
MHIVILARKHCNNIPVLQLYTGVAENYKRTWNDKYFSNRFKYSFQLTILAVATLNISYHINRSCRRNNALLSVYILIRRNENQGKH